MGGGDCGRARVMGVSQKSCRAAHWAGSLPLVGLAWAHIFLSHINGFRMANFSAFRTTFSLLQVRKSFWHPFQHSRVDPTARVAVQSQRCVPKLAPHAGRGSEKLCVPHVCRAVDGLTSAGESHKVL